MSELSCDTLFIGRNETHDLSRYHNNTYLQQYNRAPSYEGPQEDVMRRDGEARGMKQK